jgi:tocopherol O-methyltransferase
MEILPPAVQNPVLNEGIRTFYDESSSLWESVWGEHMHHGFYDTGSAFQKTRLQAQIDMIEHTLKFADVQRPHAVLDVGCGIGGSSRCSVHTASLLATFTVKFRPVLST